MVPGGCLRVPGRFLGVAGGSWGGSWTFLGVPPAVPGGAWGFPGGPWASLECPREGSGRSWEVPGGLWEVLGAPLEGPWGACRSLGGPGVSSGVHGGFLEVVIFSFLGREFALGIGKYEHF